MDNKEIYKKTLTFSIRRLLWGIGSVVVIVLFAGAGLFITGQLNGNAAVGLILGILAALVIIGLVSHFISYVFKAGQIAMMTKGITEGKLPDDVYGEGKKIVKERFTTVAAYYAITNAIKGIFNQISRVITSIGEAVGGDTGSTISSIISSVIQTVVNYLSDCCLGWVFYRKNEKATKATLEGAVLFFKRGKTLLKNLGRIFGIGLISLLCIGGVFFGITYLVCQGFPDFFSGLAAEVAKDDASSWFANANNLMFTAGIIVGVSMWSVIHSAFVRPYVLIGVLRNYIESGKDEKITEKDFDELDGKSKKFKELHEAEA